MTAQIEDDQLHIQYVSLLIHDLETPLAVAKHFIKRVESGRFDPDDPRHVKLMHSASAAIHRAERILEDTLENTRAGADGILAERKPVSLVEIMEKCIRIVSPLADDKEIGLQISSRSSIPETLCLDSALTERVLDNYLVNAIRHAPTESSIQILVMDSGSNVRISVINEAEEGFDASLLEGIFDARRQVELRWKRKMRGSGIGLAFCRKAVAAQGGHVGANGTPDGNVEFWFELPADRQGEKHG